MGGARMGMRAKLALSSAVYAKTLSLGNAALLATSAGSAASLVGIDVFRLEQSFTFFHMLWCAALARTPRRTPRRTHAAPTPHTVRRPPPLSRCCSSSKPSCSKRKKAGEARVRRR